MMTKGMICPPYKNEMYILKAAFFFKIKAHKLQKGPIIHITIF